MAYLIKKFKFIGLFWLYKLGLVDFLVIKYHLTVLMLTVLIPKRLL